MNQCRASRAPLQWGRDLSVAECGPLFRLPYAAGFASMGPRPFGRGMQPPGIPPQRAWHPASMGPRPFGRGMHGTNPELAGRQMLQWGRDLSVAEWAHDAQNRASPISFNGAATFRSRNVVVVAKHDGRDIRFNGAATFRSRNAAWHWARLARLAALQWGRDLSVAEWNEYTRIKPRTKRFNGAATFRSRNAEPDPNTNRPDSSASMGPRPFGRGMARL